MSEALTEPEERYRVVFNGQTTGDYPLAKTKARFGKAFKLPAAKVEKIFSGAEVTLKKNVTEEQAMAFAVKLAEIGCETYIELIPETLGFEERRLKDRRVKFRRGPRPGAIVPDRRLTPSRRKTDLELLEQKGDFPGNTVGPDTDQES